MKKLGYFAPNFTRKGIFKETATLPQVEFVYKPLNIYETATLVTAVMETKTVEQSTLENLKMLSEHLVEWNLLKPTDKKVAVVGEEVPEFEVVNFKKIEELKLVSPDIMNFITNAIRGDTNNPLLDKLAIDEQVKNL